MSKSKKITEEKETNLPLNCFVSRDMSWLEFNKRVMMLADDKRLPLMERLKFLAIYNSNLDEFFMARVGSLKHRALYIPGLKDIKTGRTAEEELKKILSGVSEQQKLFSKVYDSLMQDLAGERIEKVNFARLSKADETITKKMFNDYKELLSPRIIDEDHPMPFLSGLDKYMVVILQQNGKEKLALVSLYRLPKYKSFVSVSGKQKVVVFSELASYYAQSLFKKGTVKEKCIIRVTRNADVFFEDYEKEYEGDSRFDMKKLLKKRKRQLPVRLQISGKPSPQLVKLISDKIKISSKDIFISGVPFDINFSEVLNVPAELKYSPRRPSKNIRLKKGDLFRYLEVKDLFLSFPYQSINPFIDLLYEAADDPSVVSISITLYRLSASSRVAAALAYAADKGKDVLCLLELRARFDEQNNIDYSEVLEEAGCSIIYGLPDEKVHSKLCLITRKTPAGIRYITQVGTGNYNEVTSEQYTDLSIITSNYNIGHEAAEVFKALQLGQEPEVPKREQKQKGALIMAPKEFKPLLLNLLDREKEKGSLGKVSIKANSINDMDVMEKLIECSKAGVKVELFIRGICCIKPGLSIYTENITVKSVIGRYLEHSRIYSFGEGEDIRVFVGSGDLLNRNTRRRVEAFIDVTNSNVLSDVQIVLSAFREDVDNSWIMQPDGTYQRMPSGAGKNSFERLAEYYDGYIIEPLSEEKYRTNVFGRLLRLTE